MNEADIKIARGEKVLVVGESGTGKSTLVRAIAGLWPWGSGEIVLKFEGLFFMPQKPYVPLGTLRRAVAYPLSPEEADEAVLRTAVEKWVWAIFSIGWTKTRGDVGAHPLGRRETAACLCPRAHPTPGNHHHG